MTPPDFDDQSVANTPPDSGGTNPQATPAQPATATSTQQPSPANQPTQPSQTPTQTQTAQQSQTPQTQIPQAGMVSNPAPTPVDQNSSHPAVKAAGIIHSIGQALAGGDRTVTKIDPVTGTVTRTIMPLSTKQIGLSLAAAALSGAFNGLAQKGPGASGAAAASGFQQGFAQQQAVKQQQAAQAQADAESQSKAYARAASIAATNAQTILSTAEAEGRGADTLAKIAATNNPLIEAYEDDNKVLAHNVTQDELLAGMQSGKYDSTAMLGPIEGVRLLGGGRVEATHAVIQDPSAKVPLTQEAWDDYAANHVQGYQRGKQIGSNLQVPGTVLARANEQKTMFQLSQLRHDEVADALRTSDDPNVQKLADVIPSIGSLLDNPKRGAGLSNALTRAQSYFSHADINHGGRDLYESLQEMAQPSKPDPNNKGQFIPNRDAPFAQTVAAAFAPDGSAQTGWQILKAYHDEVVPEQITNEAQAADMIASSDRGSRAFKYAQRWIQSNTAQKVAIAGGEERARQAAKPQVSADSLTQPDSLGNVPTVTDPKEASKRYAPFKKNLDSLSQTEQTYNQFQSIANDVRSGKLTGAESVVALLSAVGISAAPLKGNGFRVSKDILNEHRNARGWEQSMQQKFLGAKDGDVITPKQILDYSGIASNARTSQYVNTYNQMRNAGISADAALPTGNGQKLDPNTAQIFLTLAGGDKNRARQAASAKGWAY
jgi:hypothetical protein